MNSHEMNTNENLVLDGDLPRYILEPFEVIFSDDPRYENALTREQVKANIKSHTAP